MNGNNAFGFAKTAVLLIVAAIVLYVIYRVFKSLKKIPEGVVEVGELIQETFGEIADGLSPVSQNNVFNRSFNAATGAITGDSRTLGSRIYDWLNSDKMEAILADTPLPRPVQKSVLRFDHLSEDIDAGHFDNALLRDAP